jgi:hypothetical protein
MNFKERVTAKMDETDESMLKIDIHKSIPELLLITQTGTGHLHLHLQEINLNSVQLVLRQIAPMQ